MTTAVAERSGSQMEPVDSNELSIRVTPLYIALAQQQGRLAVSQVEPKPTPRPDQSTVDSDLLALDWVPEPPVRDFGLDIDI